MLMFFLSLAVLAFDAALIFGGVACIYACIEDIARSHKDRRLMEGADFKKSLLQNAVWGIILIAIPITLHVAGIFRVSFGG